MGPSAPIKVPGFTQHSKVHVAGFTYKKWGLTAKPDQPKSRQNLESASRNARYFGWPDFAIEFEFVTVETPILCVKPSYMHFTLLRKSGDFKSDLWPDFVARSHADLAPRIDVKSAEDRRQIWPQNLERDLCVKVSRVFVVVSKYSFYSFYSNRM